MTECERIVKEKILPEEFFKEEYIDEFFVDETRKKIWAVELDLLVKFDAVCKKHNLKYFLMAGSLLGAIRHKGFIPWDDDIDVGMLREDYNRFLEIAPQEFDEPYFFQTPYTDPGSGFSFAKIRNSNTTCISYAFRYEKFNQGIFIDIFPFDNCQPEDAEARHNRIKELNLDNSTYMRLSSPDPAEQARIATHSGRAATDVCDEIEAIAQMYKDVDTEYVSIVVLSMFTYDKVMYRKACLDEIIYTDFHGLQVPIPKGYDEMLKVQYKNYMQFPPVEQRGAWHNGIWNPDVSYKEYKPE